LGGSVLEARRRKRVFKLEASGGHRVCSCICICISASVSGSSPIAGHCGAAGQIDGLTPAGNISGQHRYPASGTDTGSTSYPRFGTRFISQELPNECQGPKQSATEQAATKKQKKRFRCKE